MNWVVRISLVLILASFPVAYGQHDVPAKTLYGFFPSADRTAYLSTIDKSTGKITRRFATPTLWNLAYYPKTGMFYGFAGFGAGKNGNWLYGFCDINVEAAGSRQLYAGEGFPNGLYPLAYNPSDGLFYLEQVIKGPTDRTWFVQIDPHTGQVIKTTPPLDEQEIQETYDFTFDSSGNLWTLAIRKDSSFPDIWSLQEWDISTGKALSHVSVDAQFMGGNFSRLAFDHENGAFYTLPYRTVFNETKGIWDTFYDFGWIDVRTGKFTAITSYTNSPIPDVILFGP